MENIFVSYILSKDADGYLEENKFKKEMTLTQLPKPGDTVTTFYNENVKFYNFSSTFINENDAYLYVDNVLTIITQQQATERVLQLMPDFLAQLQSSNSINLTYMRDGEPSKLQRLTTVCKNYYDVEPSSAAFDLKKYQDIQNEMLSYVHVAGNPLNNFVRSMIFMSNTLLAHDDTIPTPDNGTFFCYDTNDIDGSNEGLSYSRASHIMGTLEHAGFYMRKKPKM